MIVLRLSISVLLIICQVTSIWGSFLLAAKENGFIGSIAENVESGVVEISPQPIKTQGTEMVCQFNVVHHHNKPHPPFEIRIVDQENGIGELKTTQALNYEEQSSYTFEMEAISCAGTYSERVRVHVNIEDVNEFSPTWDTESIKTSITEGFIKDIVVLNATDLDGSRMGEICKYEIESENQPFEINEKGVLRNTQPLNYSESHSHILSVVAYDCEGKKSNPLLVVLEVKQPCHNGWKGISSFINYIPSTGPQPLFPEADFTICPEEKCEVKKVESTVFLETRHIGKGCDRDTYNLESQRNLCGASDKAVDLLADEITEVSAHPPRDEGSLSDKSVTLFDGKMAIDLSPETLLRIGSPLPADTFTIATWLKHHQSPDADKRRKEHIICKADDHKKNRHHMALFIRNCKLVLLLRKEFSEGEENIFRPAEWRWKLPQVCDNEWHHYAVRVKFPDVDLFVDGDRWVEEKDNPEVIDDWPLHKVNDVETKTTIGACWEGSKQEYKHQLEGYLAGLWYLQGHQENAEVLRCLHQCAESLQIPAASALMSGMEMVVNGQGSKVVVDGPSIEGMNKLVEQVAYLNTREFPAPGRRLLNLSTKVTCKESEKIIEIEDRKSIVNVVAVQEPTIHITGTNTIAREYDDFKLGVRIFADVHIVMTTGSSTNGEPVNGIENHLDECQVTVSPELNGDHENMNVPDDLLKSLQITGKVTANGAVFTGAEMIYNYERLLRQVTYTNKKPAYYLNRQFKIVCSEMSRRFVSNEYTQILNVIHPNLNEDKAEHETVVKPKIAHRDHHQYGVEETAYKTRTFTYSLGESQAHNNIVAVIAVVCVGLLAIFLIVGILRIKASNHRSSEDSQAEVEMAWDDTPLNITVNPMENDGEQDKSDENMGNLEYDSSDDDLFEDDMDDDDEDDDDLGTPSVDVIRIQNTSNGKIRSRLEWDNNI